MSRIFGQMLKDRWGKKRLVCVGLDSDFARLPTVVGSETVEGTIFSFNRRIIEATADLVCAYKLNSAFYEAWKLMGFSALARTIDFINQWDPEIPVILDGKRGDIGSSSEAYARAAFVALGADAVTVNPYLGFDALKPFINSPDKGIFVLCRTSNPGAGEFQDMSFDGRPLYLHVAEHVVGKWNLHGNLGLVVGATYPNELRKVRALAGDGVPILVPGIGTQGGDLEETLTSGLDSEREGLLINLSRSIIYASSGPDFDEAARREVLRVHDLVSLHLL